MGEKFTGFSWLRYHSALIATLEIREREFAQVSFGEMVMCDNKECKTEWFHFQCVGLTENPTGEKLLLTFLGLVKPSGIRILTD